MILSHRSLLALAIVVDTALNARVMPISARILAENENLAPRHLEVLLQALVHAKILKSIRGPGGGYQLARERRRISLADIVRATSDLSSRTRKDSLLIRNISGVLSEKVGQFVEKTLEEMTLEDLCQREDLLRDLPRPSLSIDFII